MTRIPNNESHNHQSPAGQRLDERHRQQLSALVDGELGADEARFLVQHTDRMTKVCLPSPYLLGQRMWDPERSVSAYPTRESGGIVWAYMGREKPP